MGLDQYAFATTAPSKGKFAKSTELAYWRKHANLEGWMAELYYESNPDDGESFNCKKLYLDLEDLDNLETAINDDGLPHTEGFFFGTSDDSNEARNRDLDFIAKARWHLNNGDKVYYTSWW